MGDKLHHYRVTLTWTGRDPSGATPFRRHNRAYRLDVAGKPSIEGSSDVNFRGDAARWNPEDMLVASLSACHKLWYMGLCAAQDITVLAYEDHAEGIMAEESVGGGGQFTQVILRPHVTLAAGSDRAIAETLHHAANGNCFIARSMNFPVTHEPQTIIADV